MNAGRDDDIETTAGANSDVRRYPGVMVVIFHPCRKCGRRCMKVTSTQGRVRYVKCGNCGHNDKIPIPEIPRLEGP